MGEIYHDDTTCRRIPSLAPPCEGGGFNHYLTLSPRGGRGLTMARSLPEVARLPMNQRPRILHLISRLDGYGGARMLRRLAASQASGDGRVIVAALTAADGPAHEGRDAGVAVQVLGSRWPVDVVALARLNRLRRNVAVDVVHTWDLASLMHAAFTRRRAHGEAIVATLDATHTGRSWAPSAVRSILRRIAMFVAGDEATRDWLLRQGVAADRIQVIPPGVPAASPPALPRAERLGRLSLPADARVIAVAGPLRRRKNFDEAIWCFELVRVLHESARLLVIGDGPDRARLERFARQVSEPGCVRLLGYRDDMADLLPLADVYWQLDAATTTPLALLEAMAAGVPAVASDVPAHRAVIRPAETGCLAPPGNRAETARLTDEMLGDRPWAARLGAAGAALVAERWSLDAAIAAFGRLYDRVGR